MAGHVQVKLLRVLQERQFTRIGETAGRMFDGKVVAATNRDLAAEMEAGRFRPDLFYRLCGDVIRTPSLRDLLADGGETELRLLVTHLASRIAGPAAAELVPQVMDAIGRDLGLGYAWPGSFRELEQCVRNVMIRRQYRPLPTPASSTADWITQAKRLELSADQLLTAYCQHASAATGGYSAAARVIGVDRRTVAARCR